MLRLPVGRLPGQSTTMNPNPHPSLLLACLLNLVLVANAQAGSSPLNGTWRFTHALTAPWGAPVPGSAELKSQTLRLAEGTMQGPAPLDCHDPARFQVTALPPEGLFQGNLPVPAKNAAQALGLSVFPVQGLRVSCDKGVFEFHQADANTLLLSLDNRVWSLSRAAGARAPANSPAGRVQALLEQHFSGPRAMDAANAPAKVPFQSRWLNRLIQVYLAKSRSPDLVPPIDGDPYTDSQEYPTRFAVGTARIRNGRARVPVTLADAWSRRVITYELVQVSGTWQVDDLDYGKGGRFSEFLKE